MAEIEELNDLSPMPFGKHSGEAMQDVPASYLHWLWTNDCSNIPVRRYIQKNIVVLKDEFPDGIW